MKLGSLERVNGVKNLCSSFRSLSFVSHTIWQRSDRRNFVFSQVKSIRLYLKGTL